MRHATLALVPAFLIFLGSFNALFSHCDTMDGPVVADARLAFEKNNVNYILKWVRAGDEGDIKRIFSQVMKVRTLNAEARALAENYLYDNLVRIHRAGEGVPFTGVLPAGTPVNDLIKAADKAIETGNMGPLEKSVPRKNIPELKKLFDRAMGLKKFDVNDVKSGRAFVEAYVKFFHFAEGEEAHGHDEHAGHLMILIPMILSGLFFITTVIFAVLYLRIKKIHGVQA